MTELKSICEEILHERDYSVKCLHIDQAMCHFEDIKSRVRSLDQNTQNKECLKSLIDKLYTLVATCKERFR